MDNRDILLYSRLSQALRRAGLPLDLIRFVNDDEYANLILARALQSTDHELLQIALQIGDRRGLLHGAPAAPAPPPAVAPRAAVKPTAPKSDGDNDDDDDPPTRYVKSLR